jgi:type IX secretion system PorP/SprF family membrane protein
LYRNKEFYLSFNASNILDKNIDNFSGIKIEPSTIRNYQIYSGYRIKTQNWAEFEPSVFFQYFESDRRSSTDVNIKYRKYNNDNDYYWGGVTYRFLNDQVFAPLTVGPMAGLKKRGFYLGYSYQITLNELAAYNSGTHMITIGFDFLANISNCPCTQSPVHD